MTRQKAMSWVLLTVMLVLVFGAARASTTKYRERHQALMVQLEAERKRLGLTDRKALFAKYPTPEVKLCRVVRMAPGVVADLVITGKFATGTKVLFENDAVEVISDAVTPTEYRAKVRVPAGSGPTFANAEIFAPVSGGNARCLAVYVGGRYEWEFNASNGWRLKVACLDDKFKPDLTYPPNLECRAEFFRATEPKPFEVRNLRLNLTSVPYDDRYTGSMDAEAPAEVDYNVEMEKLVNRMSDPKLSDAERDKLMKQLEAMTEKMMKQQQAMVAKMQSPNYAKEQERVRAEFGCQDLQFRVQPQGAEGDLVCGQKVGTLKLKGTMKFGGL
jgi:hypothetical protein